MKIQVNRNQQQKNARIAPDEEKKEELPPGITFTDVWRKREKAVWKSSV